MHAEGKKATQTSKADDNEREVVLYLNPLSKAIACTQFEIRHLFKIEASLFFVKLKLVHHGLPHGLHIQVSTLRSPH
jgi:hypothetical protein